MRIKAHENPKLTVLIILRIIPMAINMIPRVLIVFLPFLLPPSSTFILSFIGKIFYNFYSCILHLEKN
jgi:hypothetical protein